MIYTRKIKTNKNNVCTANNYTTVNYNKQLKNLYQLY